MKKDKGRFFIHGKYFDNRDEFNKFMIDWPDQRVDLIQLEAMLDQTLQAISINDQIRPEGMTNKQAYRILRIKTDLVELKDE